MTEVSLFCNRGGGGRAENEIIWDQPVYPYMQELYTLHIGLS